MIAVRSVQRRSEVFKPIARAYALAYISSTGPKVLSLLISLAGKRTDFSDVSVKLLYVFQRSLKLNSFPTFCASIVGGSALLFKPLYQVLLSLDLQFRGRRNGLAFEYRRLLARFLASLIAGTLSFQLFNSPDTGNKPVLQSAPADSTTARVASTKKNDGVPKRESKIPPGIPPLPAKAMVARPPKIAMGIPLAGKSLDITLFAFTRAMDIVLQSSSTLQSPKSQCTRLISNYATPVLFAASSATLMHAYFYSPNRLPYTYVKWIDRLSELDERLLHALREVRYGNFVYGKDTGMAPLLGSMCKELGLPEVWGDPEQTIPIPCEVVHHGSGPSCEWHAIMRFWRAWKKALGVYAPIQAVILVRALYKQPKNFFPALAQAIYNASRNSAFLGAFVSLFYYGVCLGRTRLGPKIISSKTISPQMWDGGLCITSGCLLCGWSVLLEIPRRRVELMLFVVPRALGVWFPRWYDRVHRWREQLAFAVSAAVILTAAQERPDRVRGVFGRVLRSVVAP